MNFFALSVIMEIDDYYARSLHNFELKKALIDRPIITETTRMWLYGKRIESSGIRVLNEETGVFVPENQNKVYWTPY